MPHWRRVATYGLRKLGSLVVGMLVLATIVFFLLKLIPGDEARVVAGISATPEQVAQVRHRLGLDGSLFEQYVAFMGRIAHGDLGSSNATRAPVLQSILDVLPSTVELVLASMIIIIVLAFPLAALSAARGPSTSDSARRVLVVLASGIPAFWLALVLQRVFASNLGIFPISGLTSFGMADPRVTGASTIDALIAGDPYGALDSLAHIVLPAFALSLAFVGQLFRVLRSEMLRVETRTHITVARSVGVRRGRLVRSHMLPQALTPAISILGVEFGALFAGAVFVESIFGRPGIGTFLTTAVVQKDTPSVLGGVLVVGLIVIVTNHVVDVVQVVRDPRLRFAELGI